MQVNPRDSLAINAPDLSDICISQTAKELSNAMITSFGSVSLPNDKIYGLYDPSSPEGGQTCANGFLGEADEFEGVLRTSELTYAQPNETNLKQEFDVSFEAGHDKYRISLLDMLKPSEKDSDRNVTYDPEVARSVLKDAAMFVNIDNVFSAPSQFDELLPVKPLIYKDSGNARSVDDRIQSSINVKTEPGIEVPGSSFCKYCNFGNTPLGARTHCPCHLTFGVNKDQGSGMDRMFGMAQEGYGQVESYHGGIRETSLQVYHSTLKTEAAGWMDVADSTFR